MIKVDAKFQSLIPPLSPKERAQLEANLIAEGCHDPLVVCSCEGKTLLIDGHNRHVICTRLGLEFKTVNAEGLASRDDASLWITRDQMGRRNLTDIQRTQFPLQAKPVIEATDVRLTARDVAVFQVQLGPIHDQESGNTCRNDGACNFPEQSCPGSMAITFSNPRRYRK